MISLQVKQVPAGGGRGTQARFMAACNLLAEANKNLLIDFITLGKCSQSFSL